MDVAKHFISTKNNSRLILVLLTLIVTVTIFTLLLIGLREQRALIANQTFSERLDLEQELVSLSREIELEVKSKMLTLRTEVESHLANSDTRRACAVTFGCPEFASGLIADASIYSLEGRRLGAEASSLGDQILTLGENDQYGKLVAALSPSIPTQWAVIKPGAELRPYCWLSEQFDAVCVAVKLDALSNSIIPKTIAHRNQASDNILKIRFTESTQALYDQEEIPTYTDATQTMQLPLEHFEIRASFTGSTSPTPYWIYSGLFALVIGASITGFATATFLVHKRSIEQIGNRLIDVASTSHNLRTPLTNLKLYANLLNRKKNEPELVENYARIIDAEAGRLKKVIDNVLEIGRAGTGNNLHFEEAIPDELIHEMIATFDTNELDLEFQLSLSAPLLLDTIGFQQIIVNLVDNAIKYAAGKSIVLTSWKDKREIYFQVRDFGGINEKESDPIITQAYQRGADATGDGYGLGLTACKLIAERNHGSINIEPQTPGYQVTISLHYKLATQVK